jgi:Ca-activated chloride channel family protein
VYVDRLDEARKAFVEGLTGTLQAIAKDVKIQVEFDPAKVIRYRLLGYENRAVADADFRNNAVDAGEVGSGHEVTALYELKVRPEASGKLATVRVRSLTVDHGEAQEMEKGFDATEVKGSFADASPRFQLAACVAELAEVLRDSYWARKSSLDRVAAMVMDLLDKPEKVGGSKLGDDADVVELAALVKKADALVRVREGQRDEVALAVDAIKDANLLQARIEDEVRVRGNAARAQLEEIQRQNTELRRRLEALLAQ